MATENMEEEPAAASIKAGKFLTFQMGNEVYGIEILKVQEIIGMMPVTRVPKTPDFVRGVINLRGKVIPVLELRRKFEMEATADTERTCIVVVQVAWASGTVTMGMLVDEVSEVLNVASDQIEAPPDFGAGVDMGFILGVAKVVTKVVLLLDTDRILADGEIADVEKSVHLNGEKD